MQRNRLFLQLYVREQLEEHLIPLDQVEQGLSGSSNYLDWLSEKRDLLLSDVQKTHWIKSCTGGYITELVFHADGKLDEYRLFDRFHTTGFWQLSGGVLQVSIQKGENDYRFSVVGNRQVNIHSAIEYKNEELHSYLKLAQIK